jgi:hypothetical protein
MERITGYIKIKDLTLSLDGEVVGRGDQQNLDNFLQFSYEHLAPDYPKFYKMDRLAALGFIASEFLLKKYSLQGYKPSEMGVVLSNANGSVDTDLRYAEASRDVPSPALFVYTLPNIVAGEICIRHGIKGETAFFVSDSFDSSTLHAYVHQLFIQTDTRACLAGWVDVAGEQHDVFLYLVERDERGLNLPHSAEKLNEIYL